MLNFHRGNYHKLNDSDMGFVYLNYNDWDNTRTININFANYFGKYRNLRKKIWLFNEIIKNY